MRGDRVSALDAAMCWAPAFGGAAVDALQKFDMVVVDGVADRDGNADVAGSDVARLHSDGVLVLAYLSVGSVEDWRHYAPRVPFEWTLGAVEGWPGERYVDARQQGWRALMAQEAVTLAAAGFDGLYLDNLDVAEERPEVADGLVQLVEELHAAAPDLVLIAQNGLAVADRLPIDGIAHEDVFSRWDDGYRASPAHETARLLTGLRRLRERGLPVFTIDYTEPGATAAHETLQRALAEGFRPAVSVLELDRPPHTSPPCSSRRSSSQRRRQP